MPSSRAVATPKDIAARVAGLSQGQDEDKPFVEVPAKKTGRPAKVAEGESFSGERGISRSSAALIIGCDIGPLGKWIGLGLVRTTPDGFIPVIEVRRLTIEVHERRRANERPQETDGETEQVFESKARLEKAKADLAELEFTNRLASVVSLRAVELRYQDISSMVRTRFLALPERLADALAATTDRHAIKEMLAETVHEMLTSLAAPYKMRGSVEEVSDGGPNTDTPEEGGAGRSPGEEPAPKARGRPRLGAGRGSQRK